MRESKIRSIGTNCSILKSRLSHLVVLLSLSDKGDRKSIKVSSPPYSSSLQSICGQQLPVSQLELLTFTPLTCNIILSGDSNDLNIHSEVDVDIQN